MTRSPSSAFSFHSAVFSRRVTLFPASSRPEGSRSSSALLFLRAVSLSFPVKVDLLCSALFQTCLSFCFSARYYQFSCIINACSVVVNSTHPPASKRDLGRLSGTQKMKLINITKSTHQYQNHKDSPANIQ